MNDPTPMQSALEGREAGNRDLRSQTPRFVDALLADARIAAAARGERHEFRSRLEGIFQAIRLMVQTDAFLALSAYRIAARMRALRIPVLPWIAHRIAMVSAQISIADTAVVHPGVFIPNGQVVISGEVEVQPFVTFLPWVTIGPIGNDARGPRIGLGARIGTGAKVLGDIDVGANARIGANAVALDDVPPNTTVVGMPARPVSD